MSDECPTIIAWTRPMLDRFKKKFQQAVTNGANTFMFEGHEYVLDYAKYLIQYLDTQL